MILLLAPNKTIELKNCSEIGRLQLNNGENLIVVYSYTDVPKIEFENTGSPHFFGDKNMDDVRNADRGILFCDSSDGSKIILDCVTKRKMN